MSLHDWGIDNEHWSGGTPDDADRPREHWITGMVDDLIDQLPEIQSEAGQVAQNEQDSDAGLHVLHERIAAVAEQHYERHMAGAVPFDVADLMDQAAATQKQLEAKIAAALALTDTKSAAFREAFGVGGAPLVSLYRVVEKIRETLQGG